MTGQRANWFDEIDWEAIPGFGSGDRLPLFVDVSPALEQIESLRLGFPWRPSTTIFSAWPINSFIGMRWLQLQTTGVDLFWCFFISGKLMKTCFPHSGQTRGIFVAMALFTREFLENYEARTRALYRKEVLPVLQRIFGEQEGERIAGAVETHRVSSLDDHFWITTQIPKPSPSLDHTELRG